MIDVSVLLAAYNAEATIERALDSLCHQSLQSFEVICVDDCSTDSTLQLLRRRAESDPRIHVLQTARNSGHAVARNLALQHVQAPYVTMVDSDDWLSPDALQSALHAFQEFPLTDCVVFHLVQHFEPDGREEEVQLPEELVSGEYLTGQQACDYSLNHWQLHGLYVTRTELHQRFPYDTTCRLYSDENTTHIHYLHSRRVRACDGIYYYRQHAASQTSQFNIRRFDIMESNLSLLGCLKKEVVPNSIIQRFEVMRWENFLGCYRLYLEHSREFSEQQTAEIRQRLTTILHTFRPSRLPLRARWKPGYWLMLSPRLFDFQQRTYKRLWEQGVKSVFKCIIVL